MSDPAAPPPSGSAPRGRAAATGPAETRTALPSVGARVLAFAAILLAGAAGGFIGYAFIDLQTTGDNTLAVGLGALVGALLAAGGTAVVVVLTLRAMGEWRTIQANRPPTDATPGGGGVRKPPACADPMSADSADLTHLLSLAEGLAADAAALLVDGLSRARASVDTKSTGTDMVTEMDRASERLIVDGIRAARPDDGILGEEGTDDIGTTGVRWVVDPLDGTTNYLYAHPGFAVSIGVQIDGATVAGVVHDPLHADVFTATLGGGAFRNGRPIVASAETDLGRALVATGFSYQPERRELQAAVLTRILPKVRDIRRMGAASVDLCSVAHGRADAYYERGLQPWDHVAGALIAREAGALVGHLNGGPEDVDFVLAAPPALYEPLRELLAEAGAADPWPIAD